MVSLLLSLSLLQVMLKNRFVLGSMYAVLFGAGQVGVGQPMIGTVELGVENEEEVKLVMFGNGKVVEVGATEEVAFKDRSVADGLNNPEVEATIAVELGSSLSLSPAGEEETLGLTVEIEATAVELELELMLETAGALAAPGK